MKGLPGKFLGLLLAAFTMAAHATTYNLVPVDDSYVYVGDPATNFGGSPILATNFHWPNQLQYTFLKFDLSTIPDSEVITGAVLNLYQIVGAGYGELAVNAFRIDDDSWTESGITWNNQPGLDVWLGSSPDGHSYTGWSDWDLFQSGLWDPAGDQADAFLSIMLAEVAGGDQARQWCSAESDSTTCHDSLGNTGLPYLTITTTVVPLPGAIGLFGAGLLGLAGVAVRRPS